MVRGQQRVLGCLLLVLERRGRLQQVGKKPAEQLDGGEVLLGGEEVGLGDCRVEFGVELNRQPTGGWWLGGVAGSTRQARSRAKQHFKLSVAFAPFFCFSSSKWFSFFLPNWNDWQTTRVLPLNRGFQPQPEFMLLLLTPFPFHQVLCL